MSYLVEDSIDESPGVLRAESLTDLDSLVNGNLRGDILAVEKLIDCDSEDVSIDLSHTTHLPVLSILLNTVIDLIGMPDHAPDQTFTKVPGLLVRGEVSPEETECMVDAPLGHINLV